MRAVQSFTRNILFCLCVLFSVPGHAAIVTYDFSVAGGSQTVAKLSTYFDLFDSLFSSAIPDPSVRAAYLNAFFLSNGLSPDTEIQGSHVLPLTVSGYFSYDSDIVVPGSIRNTAGLLTSLYFRLPAAFITGQGWFAGLDSPLESITYTELEANTGSLGWDENGKLNRFVFGSNCAAGSCSALAGEGDWFIDTSAFYYSSLNENDGGLRFEQSVSFSERIPEPASLLLMMTGLAALRLSYRRNR